MEMFSGWGLFALVVSCSFTPCGSSEEMDPPTRSVSDEGSPAVSEAEGAQGTEPTGSESPNEAADAVEDPADSTLPTTIDGLVQRFSGNHGLWPNGLSPNIEATGAAPPKMVAEEMFRGISFDEGPVTEFEIVEERRVRIDEDEFTALRVQTDLGPKIVFMRYEPTGWWTRVYDGE